MPLIKLFLDICLFRKGPQDVPAYTVLFWFALLAFFLVGLIEAFFTGQWLEAMYKSLLEGTILLAFVWISLMVSGKPNRLLQTAIAALGTDAFISSFGIVLAVVSIFASNPINPAIQLLFLALLLWHMAVVAHILRHALSQSLVIGVMLSIVYVAFTFQMIVLLFGPPTATN